MSHPSPSALSQSPIRPIGIRIATSADTSANLQNVVAEFLKEFGVLDFVSFETEETSIAVASTVPSVSDTDTNEVKNRTAAMQVSLSDQAFARWTPNFNTVDLSQLLSSHFGPDDSMLLEKETLIAMLACPIGFDYPSFQEFESSFRIRVNIAKAAAKTFLSFDAYGAERPEEYWHYDEEKGFLIKSGMPLIEALRLATQPGDDGTVYSFSCYRATEYVVALGIAQEAQRVNPVLMQQLQAQAERRAIRSGEFHEVFMKEYGSRENPLPAKYYVPGDRVWFKNPDPESANALGFEGSWLFYIGSGLFSDFWKRDKTFTLELKCLEIYHWRDSTYQDQQGVYWMDEQRVQQHMRQTEKSQEQYQAVMDKMQRIQDGRGIYAEGGCIDPSREYTRWVRPGTCDIRLSDALDIQ